MAVVRLNWGCGLAPTPYWLNSDKEPAPGVDLVCDIRQGLPLESDSVDYISSMHVLPELAYPELGDALWELRRVLKPAGVLRMGLPDLDLALAAYRSGDAGYFLIPDEECQSLAGKMIVQLIWYGRSRTLFNYDFTEELLRKAGYRQVTRCAFRQTVSPYPEIIELDNRPRESFFVEAVK